jgi:hypothetical protein
MGLLGSFESHAAWISPTWSHPVDTIRPSFVFTQVLFAKLLKHYLGFSLPVMVQSSVMQFTGSMTSQEAEHGDIHSYCQYIDLRL